jgi:cytochrome c biogenesis protein CcdA
VKRFTFLAALAAVVLVLASGGTLIAQLQRIRADVAPVLDADAVRVGGSFRGALHVRLPQRYHVNSNKPRDPLLIPIVLTIAPPPGITVTEIVYPKPTDLQQKGSDQPLSVFERDFTIGAAFVAGKAVAPGEVTVAATLSYQACDETMCYAPSKVETSWAVRIVPAGAPVRPQLASVFDAIAFGSGEAPTTAPPPIVAPRQGAAATTPSEGRSGAARLDDFTLLATTGGYLGRADFLEFVRNAERGVQPKGLFEGRGPLAILLIVFLGGLALNLTPCVLPMIPINLAIIGAGAQAGSRTRGFWLGSAYGLAMAVVYGVLGLVVILTAGTFGTINASPWFNLGIALLFVVLALAMFDVLIIDFSKYSSRFAVSESGRGTFLVAFAMGAVSALLAGACVAPVVIQVVLFSSNLYAAGTTAALALPFFLGIGMAVPWPIAGAGLAALPKPGAWMVRVKQAFGVVILATAVYYGYQAYALFSSRFVDAGEVTSSVEEKLKAGWHASLGEGLEVAARERKPVLIDLWATWCKNCLTMDKTTLANAEVTTALAGYVKIKVQAEHPDAPPAKDVMQRLGAIGLPTYAILRPKVWK